MASWKGYLRSGVSGSLSAMRGGLEIYGTLKGAYEVGRSLYAGARLVAAIAAPAAAMLV